jgi:hypothetical protein
MAYDPNNLSVLAYANGFTMWHYRTDDAASDVDTSGYFNEAANMLRTGDFVFANANLAATPQNGVFVVLSNSGGVVDASDMTGFGTANTD